MSNKEKYDAAFIESFSLEAGTLSPDLAYNGVPEWDSIGHMGLIAALEDAFAISMETDDIVEFSSYAKGMEILKKYAIEI
ncbi:MAG: acyl carrier protein [Rhodospirillaceae bacterium]|nr:acyl carrier protein [Rhodospirillales bacterium]